MVYLSSAPGILASLADAFRRPAATGLTLAAFLAAAMWLAAESERCGLADRLADLLGRAGGGRPGQLYAAVCGATALLTALVSLDGAVVVMLPALRALERRGVALRPLLAGTIAVANAFSMTLPQGNPANLVVMSGLGLSPGAYLRAMVVPGLLATALAATAVALGNRSSSTPAPAAEPRGPLTPSERRALAGLAVAAAGELAAPFVGIAPWWPLCAAALVARLAAGRRAAPVRVPWRICVTVTLTAGALAAAAAAIGVTRLRLPAGPLAVIAVALAVGALAAVVNNLPAGAALGGLVAGPAGYAAVVGLSAGSLATRHGSVATLLALDGAGPAGQDARRGYVRRWLPVAAAATVAAAAAVALTAG